MSEEENIIGELHGHLTQMVRTAMSGGLQITEQRARRLQQEAEAERQVAIESARQLEERKRAEAEMNVLLAQQRCDRQDRERAVEPERTVEAERAVEGEHGRTMQGPPTTEPTSVLDLDMDLDMELDLGVAMATPAADLGR